MLRRVGRAAFAAAVLATAVLATAPAAEADGRGGSVLCVAVGQRCTLFVQTPGVPVGPVGTGAAPAAPVVPPAPPAGTTAAAGSPQAPTQAMMAAAACGIMQVVLANTGRQACPAAPRAAAAQRTAAAPAPAVLARQAVSQLRLPSPLIMTNPSTGQDQLVGLPTWLWLAGGWGPVSAAAAVPGEAVTATASPQRVTWATGDGAAVTCQGPGTPYVAGGDPAAASPTCGHTYTTSSARAPGGRYPVTATITWTVTWAGAGTAGSFPGLTTTSGTTLAVAESQALVTGSTP